jgi:hypothetical protein
MIRNKFWALIAGALLLFSIPANAQQQCFPMEQVEEAINAQFPIRRVVKLDEQQTKDVLFWWNSQPPQTDDKYNSIWLVQFEGFIGLMLGNDGDVCQVGRIPDELMESFLLALRGVTATQGPQRGA